MTKNIKYLLFFLVLVLFVSCSFDNNSGIWSDGEKEKKRIAELEKKQNQKIEVIKIYSSEDTNLKEIPAVKSISLTKPKTNSSWKMSGLNTQNFLGKEY